MNNKIYDGVVGKGKMGMKKDTDGDGLIDPIDCDPNDPNKQGLLHDIKEKYENFKSKRALEKEQEKQLKASASREKQKVYVEERRKYLTEQARKEAKAKARNTGGNFADRLATFSSNTSKLSNALVGSDGKVNPKPVGTKSKYVKKTTYVKSGKGYKKKTIYKKVPVRQKPMQKTMQKPTPTSALNVTPGLSSMLGGSNKKKNKSMLRL